MESSIVYPTNRHQTPITRSLQKELDPEVYANLMEFITTVHFVKMLVAEDRPMVKDMPKDKQGRVIVDIANPHILENMEFFIEDRIRYDKYGYYTSAKFSRDPHSEYKTYWDEQMRRSIEGYVNPKTGEWVSGYLYFYWNFSRILLTEEVGEEIDGKVRSDREEEFPDLWEIDYFYYHYIETAEMTGTYAALLKCRGVGASFKSASKAIRNFFLIKKSKSYLTASFDGYLFDDGIVTKFLDMESFLQENTAFKKKKIFSSPDHFKAGYKNKALNNAHSGFLSEMITVNTKDPNAIRGKRGKLVIHEEFGSNRRGLDTWGIADKSLNDRGNVFGLQIGQGTGGDDQSDFFSLTQIFFKPKSYSVCSMLNVFDKNMLSTRCGFFIGDYMNKPRSYNKNGVTDVVMNLIGIFKERQVYERELEDPDAIAKKKAESAITPLEAITVMHNNVFPKEAAKQAIAVLAADYKERTKGFHHCMLKRFGEKVMLQHSSTWFPILEYPYTGKQAHNAAVTIKKMPKTHADGSIPSMRYIIGVDTLEDDDTTGSFFAVQVMDLWTDDIVAWYIGRFIMISENYDIVLNLCLLYNATCNYENNLKGLYGHFRNHNALRYLADTPQILADKGYASSRQRQGNTSKGTRAVTSVNVWGNRLQADWMRKPHTYYTEGTGMDTIDDIEYLREISMFDPFGNFDKVSSGNMLFIYREDLVKITESSKFGLRQEDDYNTDDFFDDMAPILDEEF